MTETHSISYLLTWIFFRLLILLFVDFETQPVKYSNNKYINLQMIIRGRLLIVGSLLAALISLAQCVCYCFCYCCCCFDVLNFKTSKGFCKQVACYGYSSYFWSFESSKSLQGFYTHHICDWCCFDLSKFENVNPGTTLAAPVSQGERL